MPLGLYCPKIQDLSFGLKIRLASNPAKMAAAIPPAEDLSPPVNIPKNPFSYTASLTPLARRLPNPVSGTLAPAPANSVKGSYTPSPPRITPMTTKLTKIRAGVSLVLSMRICPMTQNPPPTANEINYSMIFY